MLKEQIKLRTQLIQLQKRSPLALAQLWVPHCHRFDGLAKESPREKGCGKPMKRIDGNIWECSTCNIREVRTSQRDPFHDLGEEATAVFGGNRAGKSEIGAMFSVATAASSSEWWVREWLKNNNLPFDIVPTKPSDVLVSALSYSDALAYVRPKISKFLPAGCRFKNWNSHNRAKVILPNGGTIISMSADSGRRKYQGIGNIKLAWLDEEHPQDIFEESLLRCVDARGKILLTMTPLLGITWPNELFVNTEKTDSFKYHFLSGLDNPYVSSVKMRKATSHLSEASQQSRLYGKFTNQTGLVYPEINQKIHVIKPIEIKKEWKRFLTIDFGCVNPFACLVCCLDENTNTLYIVDEYYRTQQTTIANGHEVNRRFKKYAPFEFVVCDPESKDSRMILARNCNLPNKPAPKHLGVVNTINLVKHRLQLQADDKPRLYIFNRCKELLKEFRLYSWAKNQQKDLPQKKHDHGLDALRYLCAFLYRIQRHL